MNDKLARLLEHLCGTIDVRRQTEAEALRRRALKWEQIERLPVTMAFPLPPDFPFPPFPYAETLSDPEKMLFNELAHAFGTSIACRDVLDDDLPCTVRANFGAVLVASLFGAPVRQVADNPPWVAHADGQDIALESVPDWQPALNQGWLPRVLETYEAYARILSADPVLQAVIQPVLPDLQSPFDNLELIVGSSLFEDLRARPALAERALQAVGAAQIGAARQIGRLIRDGSDGFAHQHATAIRGRVLLRNDSVLMMSPGMYLDQVAPHDRRVLEALGGGGIHCCGAIGSHAQAFLDVHSVQCLDIGQPEMNDLNRLYEMARARGVPLVRVDVPEEDLVTGRVCARFPTGVTLRHKAASLAEARRIMRAYRQSVGCGAKGPPRQ